MDTNLTSIIMITRDRAKFLPFAIDSVLAQDISAWELVIVDDGSTDDTESVVAGYAAKPEAAGRISYTKNPGSVGISRARNQALALCKGKYIAVLDSDDIWSNPRKLSQQVAFLETHPKHALVGSNVRKINASGADIGAFSYATEDTSIRNAFLMRNQFCHSATLMRREALDAAGHYDESLDIWEDYDLFLRIGKTKSPAGAIWQLANLSDPLASYRVHGGNISKDRRAYGARLHLKIIEKYKNDYPNYAWAKLKGIARLVKSSF